MWTEVLDRRAISVLAVLLSMQACKTKTSEAKPEAARSATAVSAAPVAETPPQDCRAGDQPVELGKTNGQVHGLTADATYIYFATWQPYGGRGDLAKVRKDGKGLVNLSSLSLEPRAVVVDDQNVFFSSGIRLMTIPKAGGASKVLAETFSSQGLAGNAEFVFGVPGDYGPYDRLIRAEKESGKTFELDVSERPDSNEPPRGFSAIAVDASGIYVTDSSANRVLKFGFERAKPKVLATGQPKPFALAVDDTNVYFTLAKKKELMRLPKAGGAATKLDTGLALDAPVTTDAQSVYTVQDGENETKAIVKIAKTGGKPDPIAVVARDRSVDGMTVDQRCVYWIERESGSGNAVVFARAR